MDVFETIVELITSEWPNNVPVDGFGSSTKLFYDGICLDSVDGVTLVLLIEERFGFRIDPQDMPATAFEDLRSLAQFVETCREEVTVCDQPERVR